MKKQHFVGLLDLFYIVRKRNECRIQLHVMHNNIKVAQFSLLDKANDSKMKEHPGC